MSSTSLAIAKFTAGSADPISNEDLPKMIAYFDRLEKALSPCPPEYQLMLTDVRRRLDILNGFKAARADGSRWARNYSQQRTEAANAIDYKV